MRVLFVQTNVYTLLYPLPIGPAMVAARLKRDGHDVRFVDLMGERDPVRTAREASADHRPDLVCYSIRNRDNQRAAGYFDPMPGIAAVAEAIRHNAPAPVLLGGTGFTTFPVRTLDCMKADYGIAGDDLEPVSRFVASLSGGSPDLATPGLVYRDTDGQIVQNSFELVGYRHLDTDYQAHIDRRRYRRAFWQAAVVTRSGCPETCAFCDTFHTYGRRFILRDPGEVADEILELKRYHGVRAVYLVDAGFNRPLDHAKEILREMIRRGAQVQLSCVYDPGTGDYEFFSLFRRAGGLAVMVFAASLSDPVLCELRAPFDVSDVMRDAEAMRRAGVSCMFMPVFGSPGETPETVRETVRRTPLLHAIYVDHSIGWRIQPRTPLRDRAVAEGLISADDDCWNPTFYISPETPRDWLERALRPYRRRNLLNAWRMAPFILHAMVDRPWKRGPELP